jgi:hypothetical protein
VPGTGQRPCEIHRFVYTRNPDSGPLAERRLPDLLGVDPSAAEALDDDRDVRAVLIVFLVLEGLQHLQIGPEHYLACPCGQRLG